MNKYLILFLLTLNFTVIYSQNSSIKQFEILILNEKPLTASQYFSTEIKCGLVNNSDSSYIIPGPYAEHIPEFFKLQTMNYSNNEFIDRDQIYKDFSKYATLDSGDTLKFSIDPRKFDNMVYELDQKESIQCKILYSPNKNELTSDYEFYLKRKYPEETEAVDIYLNKILMIEVVSETIEIKILK